MRIGLFTDTYLPVINGCVTSVVTLRNGLIEQGHEVFVVSNHGHLLEISYEDNILLLPGIPIKMLWDNNLSGPFQKRGFEIVKSMNLDIIHINSEFGIGGFAQVCGRKLNIPIVYTYHTTWEDYTHYVNPIHSKIIEKVAKKSIALYSRKFASRAKAVITPSKKTKELLVSYGVYQPIYVIPTGLDLNKFNPTEHNLTMSNQIRNKYNIGIDDTLFIFVGRLGHEKNLNMVIDAFQQIQSDHVKFMIVGGGPIFSEIESYIKEKGLEHKILMTNSVPNDQIAAYYLSADGFISASMSETQGLTFVEAMASGCVLFAKDRGVVSDLCLENETGFYFDNQQELIDKITHFINLSLETKREMKSRVLKLVQPYRKEVFISKVAHLYQNILSSDHSHFEVTYCQLENDLIRCVLNNPLATHLMYFNPQDANDLGLREGVLISKEKLNTLLEKDLVSKLYHQCLNKLTYKDYSLSMMSEYLTEINPEQETINTVVLDLLKEKGFIDDFRLLSEIIERERHKGYGASRILSDLEKYKFDASLLELVKVELDDYQENDFQEKLQDLLKLNLTGSKQSVFVKIRERLIRLGYSSSQIQSGFSFSEFNYDELESCAQDLVKLKNKGYDEFKCRNKLYQKGYANDSISRVLKEVYNED